MYSIEQMNNLWKVFLTQIPADPEVKSRLKEINKLEEEYNEKMSKSVTNNETVTVKQIFNQIKNDETLLTKPTKNVKIYRADNLKEYKEEKEKKDSGNNE